MADVKMIKVGQKVWFDPLGYITGYCSEDVRGNFVKGTVAFVNEENKWFSVVYGNNRRASFKFCQIGEDVKIVG